ncbi:c-type cytochrome [Maribacter halichondriae]|uniref:c-type cytochrome n=1 Tax=Maribacter halichondriae TaxID=2980554 RepID=UPI002359E168|nr:cytochrome c [Maribacter sp. Hal144]
MKTFCTIYFLTILGLSAHLFQDPALEESVQRGSEIYADFCVTCHLEKGEGVMGTFPPLAKSDYLMKNREASIRGVKYGQQIEIMVNGVTYNSAMPDPGLEDEEIADVINYILNSWGNSSDEMVTVDEVEVIQK